MAEKDLSSLEQCFLSGPYNQIYRMELATSESSRLELINRATIKGISLRLKNLSKLAEGSAYSLVTVLLARSDMYNARAILRKFYRGNSNFVMPKWHDYGLIEASFFEDMWNECKDPMLAIERCHSSGLPTAVALAASLDKLQMTDSIVEAERTYIEDFINWSYETIDKVKDSSSDLVSQYLGRLIDLWNMNMWVRLNHGTFNEGRNFSFIERGNSLSVRKLNSSKTLSSLFAGTSWKRSLAVSGDFPPPELTRLAQRSFWLWQLDQKKSDPLGIGVPIGYIAKQLLEWRNMDILSVGLSAGLTPARIKRLLLDM